MDRGFIAEIDLSAVSCNLKIIRGLAANLPVIAVVKADAYGHGAVEVARHIINEGTEYLAVAFTGEARELREAGIDVPIIVFFDADIEDVIKYDLVPVISEMKIASALSEAAVRMNRKVKVHIKIDTGMGRMGITGGPVGRIMEIAGLSGIEVDGVMSHFSEADLFDTSFAKKQIDKFREIKTGLNEKGLDVRCFHMANSAAVMTLPEAYFDAVRPGLMLYGYSPLQNPQAGAGLVPVMSVKSRIIALRKLAQGSPVSYGRTFITERESLIGVMSAGYADGFSRSFSNNAEVLVRGSRAPVVGRVCMDLTMIDLTDVAGVEEGDEVVIIGRQGDECIDASELAARSGTIPYEILLSLGHTAKKVYI